MRKSLIGTTGKGGMQIETNWRDLEKIARVEVTSEDAEFPIEHALGKTVSAGWRASSTGPQIIRLIFDEVVSFRKIQVHIVEKAAERMQELTILAGAEISAMREVLKQQFTFSPGGSTEELEEYGVELAGIKVVELRIDPDRSHDPSASRSYASLKSFRLA